MSPNGSPGATRHTALTDWLSGYAPVVQHQLESASLAESHWSLARLATFLLLTIAWYPFHGQPGLALLVGLASAALFACTIRRHRIARAEHTFLKLQALVGEESSHRLTCPVTAIHSAVRPADVPIARAHVDPLLPPGRTWLLTNQECDDLDLYASPVGLFGLLNRTSTDLGAMRLRDCIENLRLEPARILARQQAVRWLAEHHDQRFRLLARLAGLRGLDGQVLTFQAAVESASQLMPLPGSWALRLWSLVSVVVAVVAIAKAANNDLSWGFVIGALTTINILLWLPLWSEVRKTLAQWQRASGFIQEYRNVACQAADDLPDQTELATLRTALAAISHRRALPGMIRWLNWSATGGFVQMLMDLFAFYDIHVLEGIQRHVLPHRRELIVSLAAVAELEALLSLACFAAEQPGCCWPEMGDHMQLSIERGRHPLIDPAEAVANSVHLSCQPNLWIVTGSNMSGKSTLLRMVGVNVVLAQSGCVVLADAMSWSPMRLITDLRIRDNLNKGESYFLAEVRQLRRMVVPPAGAEPVLGLVDEPFRGTNHREQRAATLAIIEQLVGTGSLFLIATHDATVTRIADGTHAQNLHFQEQLGERELTFDYQLRSGPARTRNAIRVLEREQYPADLVRRALTYADSRQPNEMDTD